MLQLLFTLAVNGLALEKRKPPCHNATASLPPKVQVPAMPTSTSPAPTQTPVQTVENDLTEFEKECLYWHNQYREAEGRKPLVWNSVLKDDAQLWAKNLTETSKFEHSELGHGENLYQATNGDMSCKAAVTAWYNEKPLYTGQKIPDPKNKKLFDEFEKWGHFTQLEWRETTAVGCAKSSVKLGRDVVQNIVCEYDPQGNVIGSTLE